MGRGPGSRGELWARGQWPLALSLHVRHAPATARPPQPVCTHPHPTRRLLPRAACWRRGVGSRQGSLVSRWSPVGTVSALKDHRAHPPYVPDEIEGQRGKIHLFNLSSAGLSFPLSNKDSSDACQIQKTQPRGPLLSRGFCSDGEGDTINLELEAALPRLVGGHRAEPGPSAVPFPGPVCDDSPPSLEPGLQFSLKSRWKHLEGLKLDFSLDTSEPQRVIEVHVTFDQLRLRILFVILLKCISHRI